jgi:RNA polymerase sigma-70 factor (ECF subfamily)
MVYHQEIEMVSLLSKQRSTRISQETALIRQARQGNPAALDLIYRLHSIPVYRLCVRLTGNEAEAQELTEEVFLRLFRTSHALRGQSGFGTWLHRIAASVVLDYLRRNKVLEASLSGVAEGKAFPTQGPESRPQIASAIVREAVNRLPSMYKEIVVLHYFQDLTYAEIAKVLHCSPSEARSRIHRARLKLSKALRRLLDAAERKQPESAAVSAEEMALKSTGTKQERLISRYHYLVDKKIEGGLSPKESVQLEGIEKHLEEMEDAQTSRIEQALEEEHRAMMQKLNDLITELRRITASTEERPTISSM